MADLVDNYNLNKTNASRLTKGRKGINMPTDLNFPSNRKQFLSYLKAKETYYLAHDKFILILYQLLSKYENQGFSSQDFLKMMNYTKRGINSENFNLVTLIQNLGRMDFNSEQFNIYIDTLFEELLSKQLLNTEDAAILTDALVDYDKAYLPYRNQAQQLYKMDQKGSAQIRAEVDKKNAIQNGQQSLEQTFLYAITTAEKETRTSTHANSEVYLLNSDQMDQFLSNDMYFSVHNVVNKLGLLQYTRFGANTEFSTDLLKFMFPEIEKSNQNILKEYFNIQSSSAMTEMKSYINERYSYIEAKKQKIYGRAAEAGIRGYFAGTIMPIEKGENELGLREGDVVVRQNGKEIHISVKNIKNYSSQSYDEFKERAPEDMAYILSSPTAFQQQYNAIPKDSIQQEQMINKYTEEINNFLDNNPQYLGQVYDASGLEQIIIETLSQTGYTEIF